MKKLLIMCVGIMSMGMVYGMDAERPQVGFWQLEHSGGKYSLETTGDTQGEYTALQVTSNGEALTVKCLNNGASLKSQLGIGSSAVVTVFNDFLTRADVKHPGLDSSAYRKLFLSDDKVEEWRKEGHVRFADLMDSMKKSTKVT